MAQEVRPLQHAASLARRYPGCWRHIDALRSQRGRMLPDWPTWCFVPMAGTYAIVAGGGDLRPDDARLGDMVSMAALAAWRTTQLVYRYDVDLLDALAGRDVPDRLPSDALRRLPTWCPYVTWHQPRRIALKNERTGDAYERDVHGYYVWLEYDVNESRPELRWLLDLDDRLLPVILHLDRATIGEAIESMLEVAERNARSESAAPFDRVVVASAYRQMLSMLLPTTLYLCADNADVDPGALAPQFPTPTKTRDGWRLFPPGTVTAWDVGIRIGAALRAAAQSHDEQQGAGGPRTRPRAHVRRAHWHHFWTGPRSGTRELVVHWLPPVTVNLVPGARLPVTVRPVRR